MVEGKRREENEFNYFYYQEKRKTKDNERLLYLCTRVYILLKDSIRNVANVTVFFWEKGENLIKMIFVLSCR